MHLITLQYKWQLFCLKLQWLWNYVCDLEQKYPLNSMIYPLQFTWLVLKDQWISSNSCSKWVSLCNNLSRCVYSDSIICHRHTFIFIYITISVYYFVLGVVYTDVSSVVAPHFQHISLISSITTIYELFKRLRLWHIWIYLFCDSPNKVSIHFLFPSSYDILVSLCAFVSASTRRKRDLFEILRCSTEDTITPCKHVRPS